MTEFFTKLRKALDEACPQRHIQIHLRGMWSMYDTRFYGMDCEALAKAGLVDAIISYPQRYREIIKPDFYENGKIDLEKYKEFMYRPVGRPFIRKFDNTYGWKPYPDSNGVPQGPEDLNACVAEWMKLEEKYGVKIYIELMPRIMSPEDMKKVALDIYAAGAERIALWDTYGRVTYNGLWNMIRNLGHKEELADMNEPCFRDSRFHEIAGFDVTLNHPVWGG